MVELRRHPGGGVVTGFAGLRESLRRVVRIIGVLIILQVARHARLDRQIEVPVCVALIALQGRMRAGQGEAHQVVIEGRGYPRHCRVTVLTGLRHPQCHVVWIIGLLIVRHVATRAACRCSFEFAANMTGRALQRCMHASQCKARELQVIEIHAEPRIHVVAFLAGSRKSRTDMAGAGGLLKILCVAGVALGRHRGVVAQGAIFMARVTVNRSVGAYEREAVVMVLNCLD